MTGKAQITSNYMNAAFSALTGLNAIIGLFSSMAVNMPDFGRFSKNGFKGYHQFFALPVIGEHDFESSFHMLGLRNGVKSGPSSKDSSGLLCGGASCLRALSVDV